MAERVEEHFSELMEVGEDEVEQIDSGLGPDSSFQFGHGLFVAFDQSGDDGGIGLDGLGRRPTRVFDRRSVV